MRKEQYTDMKKVFTGILAGVGLITFALIVLMIFNGFLNSQSDQSLVSYYDQLHEGDSEYFIAEALEAEVETQFASATVGGTSSCWVSPTTKQACGAVGETTSSISYIYYQTNCGGNPSYKRVNSSTTCSTNGTGTCYALTVKDNACGLRSLKNPGNNYSVCYNIPSTCTSADQQIYKRVEQCVWVCGANNQPIPTATVKPTPISTPTPFPSQKAVVNPVPQNQMNQRVLFLSLNPSNEKTSFKQEINVYTGHGAKSYADLDNQIAAYYVNKFNQMTGNTVKFTHVGSSDFTALPNNKAKTLTFEKSLECANARTMSEQMVQECKRNYESIDYESYFKENGLCKIAEQYNADQIWLYAFRFQMAQEFFYIGPEKVLGAYTYIDPTCKRPYAVIIGGYPQPYYGFLHHFSHYSETVMQYITLSWTPADREKHFDRFVRMDWYRITYTANKTINFALPTCGNTHYPGNTKTNYGYTDKAEYNSACKDWGNFPDYTNRTERVSCTAWGCTDNGWQEYFLSSIPRSSGTTTLRTAKGKVFTVKKNWWPYILDLREATAVVNSTK